MSTREYFQTIVNRLTDEQINKLVEFVEDNFLPEPPNTVHSKAELEAMLAEAEEDVRNGRVHLWEDVKRELMEDSGI